MLLLELSLLLLLLDQRHGTLLRTGGALLRLELAKHLAGELLELLRLRVELQLVIDIALGRLLHEIQTLGMDNRLEEQELNGIGLVDGPLAELCRLLQLAHVVLQALHQVHDLQLPLGVQMAQFVQ